MTATNKQKDPYLDDSGNPIKIIGCSIKRLDETLHTILGWSSHAEVMMKMDREGLTPDNTDHKGFMCSDGVWRNRKQALVIAQFSGQVKKARFPSEGLFSDDLWP